MCGLCSSSYRREAGPDGQVLSIKKELREDDRHAGRWLMKREDRTRPRTDAGGTSQRTQ